MEPNTEGKTYSTMTPHHPSSDNNDSSPLSPLHNNINPNLINPPTNSPTTFVENTNDDDQELNHRQTITNNVSNDVISDVNNNMDGLTREEWPFEYPPGYRFCPEDGELIVYYLRRRIRNLNLPHDKIKDVNLYRTTPDIVTEEHEPVGDNEWYFFTPRDRKYRNGSRPNRAAGGTGYWKATGADKPIKFHDQLVGFRKALVFYEGRAPKGMKTNWIMHEYKVMDATERVRAHENDMRLDDWVLCRIYNKTDNKTSKTYIKSEINNESAGPNPASSTDDECLLQPLAEIVEEDEKPHLPFPSMDYIEDDVYNSMMLFGEDPELFFTNYDIKNSLDSIIPPNLSPTSFFDRPHHSGVHSFYNFQSNDFQSAFFDSEVKPLIYNNPSPDSAPSKKQKLVP